ncbi:MAG: hypothetical protein ACYCW6_27885 [Candidatus Xenobia bacterium]
MSLICFKCGSQNAPGSNFCNECNAALPKMQQTDSFTPPPRINERYMQIKDAGDKVVSGEISLEEYCTFLDRVISVLEEKERQIREIEIPPEAVEDFREELETGFTGIDLYNQGLQTMRYYAEEPDAVHIETGLQLIREGNEMINDAMRINRENRRKLEEMYIDTSTML